MEYVWNEDKNRRNIERHGIAFNLKRAVEFAMQAPADNPAAVIGIPSDT